VEDLKSTSFGWSKGKNFASEVYRASVCGHAQLILGFFLLLRLPTV
jgi:hypothetical protein